MEVTTQHISVCICTYKRQQMLQHLLEELGRQETDGQFTYSIVVADNDSLQSAKAVVQKFTESSDTSISYCVEPIQNIALARNKAIENAKGDFVAFIDDDEFPTARWLLTLFSACNEYKVDGVLGPVKPHFDQETPRWVIKGKFYDRPTYSTGLVIDWSKGRTGNVLLRKSIFSHDQQPFRPEFRTGEDQDFFGRMIEKGHIFIWCNEAVAYEWVPSIRWKRRFIIKRTLFRGSLSLLDKTFGARDITKSVIAIPLYTATLPFALVCGHHRFMNCLVKLSYHVGRILAVLGINPIRDAYVTE